MRILVVYGSATGQTRKIVEFLAERWRGQAHTIELCDAARLPRRLDPSGFDRIVVASCVRQGVYRRAVMSFVRRYPDALTAVPSVFLSVSMAAANVLNRADARRWLQGWVDTFSEKTGWTPALVHHVAGGLPFTRYDIVTKWIMRRIAEEQGYDTDTAHDHEYTDWAELGDFADALVGPSFAETLARRPSAASMATAA
jgi:menaquinone-dependent protoporphyrinogen oxidase